MRRKCWIAVLMMLLCLLCACSGKKKDELQAPVDFRASLLGAGGCTFILDGKTEVEGKLFTYALRCRCTTDGASEVEVTAPESIAGIRIRTAPGEAKLLYDGVELTFGETDDPRLSPAAAPATLIAAWTEAFISDTGREEGKLQVCYRLGYDDDAIYVYTRFDDSGKPVSAELVFEGSTVSTLTVSEFAFSTGGNNETTEEDLG